MEAISVSRLKNNHSNDGKMNWKGGIRIIDVCELAKQMYCKECQSVLDLNRTRNERKIGLASVLTIVCFKCGQNNVVHSSQRHCTGSDEPAYFVNVKASMSIQKTNICVRKLDAFFSDLGVPLQSGWRMLLDTRKPAASHSSLPDSHLSSSDSHQAIQLTTDPLQLTADTHRDSQSTTVSQLNVDYDRSAADCLQSHVSHKQRGSSPESTNSQTTEDDLSKVLTDKAGESSVVVDETAPANIEDEAEGCPTELGWTSSNTEQVQLTAVQADPDCHTLSCSITDGLPEDRKHLQPECGSQQHSSLPGQPAEGQGSFQNEDRYIRPACGRAFSDGIQLDQHKLEEQHSADAEGQPLPFACGKCDRTFATPTQLNRHIRTVHKKKAGNKGRKAKVKLNDRRKLGNITFPYTCKTEEEADVSDGDSGCSAHGDLERAGQEFDMDTDHVKEKEKDKVSFDTPVTGKGQFKCKVCTAVLSTARSLGRHVRQRHPEESNAYPCPHCPLGFQLLARFCRHLGVEHDHHPYACADCGETFRQAARYYDHRRRHHLSSHQPAPAAGECKRPFMCETCGNTYIRIFELRRHERVHTNDRAFRCGVCGSSFLQLSHLISHRRTHTGERPYVCERCGKSFSQKSSLYLHSKTHREGLEALECQLCGKKLKNQRTMLKHRETCKGSYRKRYGDYRDFVCNTCGKDCRHRQGINYHRKTGCKVTGQLQGLKEYQGMDSQGMFCTRCHQRFSTQPLLLRHIRLVCGQEGKPVDKSSTAYCMCQHCGEEFSSKSCRRYHVSAHCPHRHSIMLGRLPEVKMTVDRSAPGYCVCSYCGEEFESKNKRRYHVSQKCAQRTRQEKSPARKEKKRMK